MDGTHTEMTPEYERNLERGLNYQYWVKQMFPKVYKNRSITYYEGKQNQLKGESLEGIEVKLDEVSHSTGRVYIEVAEKSNSNNATYVPSGIYREDNTKLYLVGNYSIWFIFSKRHLRWLDKLDPPFILRVNPIPTSKGFCIPIINAKKLCLDYQVFNQAS